MWFSPSWRTFCLHLNVSICFLFAKGSIVRPSDTIQEVQRGRPNIIYPRKKQFGLDVLFLTIYWFSWFLTFTLPGRDKCPLILFLTWLHTFYHNRWGCGTELKSYCAMLRTPWTKRPQRVYHLSKTSKGNWYALTEKNKIKMSPFNYCLQEVVPSEMLAWV